MAFHETRSDYKGLQTNTKLNQGQIKQVRYITEYVWYNLASAICICTLNLTY